MIITVHANDILRAIYSGMGFADDPDIDDYYTRACSFPIMYSPDDDPEVIEEMCIAAAGLKVGGNNIEVEDIKGLESSSSTEDEGGAEEDWRDEDENVKKSSAGPSKHKQKTLSSVDKVHKSYRLDAD